MKIFIVGYIDFNGSDLLLEKIIAESWMRAVEKHSKYPWKECEENSMITVEVLQNNYLEYTMKEAFKQSCFDCDTMMNWIEIYS